MTKPGILSVLALVFAVPTAAQPTVGWPETIDRLNEERSQAEACVGLLKDSGDAAAIRKGRIVYGTAKAASDGVIAGFAVGLVEGYKPEKLPPLQANLERAGKGLKEVCEQAVAAGLAAGGSKGIVEDLAKGAVEPVVDGLKVGAGALWSRHVEEEKLEIETIKGQLEAAKWPEFGP
jgi:hypothetical protein